MGTVPVRQNVSGRQPKLGPDAPDCQFENRKIMVSKDHNQNETKKQNADSTAKPAAGMPSGEPDGASPITDFWRALALLSRIPVAGITDFRPQAIAKSVWTWPLVGLLLAGFAVLPAMLAFHLTENLAVFVLVALAGMVLLTGAMHEDGMADCADGFGGGFERSRKLEIMRDSYIGTYGVVALILCFGLRLTLLYQAAEIGQAVALFLILAITSRAAMPIVMYVLPPARKDGLGKGAGKPPVTMVALGLLIAMTLSFVLSGPGATIAVLVGVFLATLLVVGVAKWQIGGQTGDVLGATQIMTELLVGIAFVAAI